jgi:hypothetical protein
MKHVVCYSGGHSSALVAIEVVRKYGKEDVVLLNHDINANVEEPDIKRFKNEIAAYLGLPVTYANHKHFDTKDQFDISLDHGGFLAGDGNRASMSAVCTRDLKTRPFHKWLEENVSDKDCTIYYGFDKNETRRIQRRSQILGVQGYKSDYPLALWERTIQSSNDIGIAPPLSYGKFKHANCTGCLKAGKQHWYVVFCERPDIWEKAKKTEEELGYSIIKGSYLETLEPKFNLMKKAGVAPTEHIQAQTFWAQVRHILEPSEEDQKPCECTV